MLGMGREGRALRGTTRSTFGAEFGIQLVSMLPGDSPSRVLISANERKPVGSLLSARMLHLEYHEQSLKRSENEMNEQPLQPPHLRLHVSSASYQVPASRGLSFHEPDVSVRQSPPRSAWPQWPAPLCWFGVVLTMTLARLRP